MRTAPKQPSGQSRVDQDASFAGTGRRIGGLRLLALVSPLILPIGASRCAAAEAPAVDIPLGDFHGRPTVAVRIGDEGPFTFILDTGAGVSVLDHGLRERLGLSSQGETEIGSPVGGTVAAHELSLGDVTVGGLALGEVPALAIDLAQVIGGGDAPVGVLATAAFRDRSITFDFLRERLSVLDAPLPPADGREIFDFCSATGKPSLAVTVGGQTFCVNLDTGSPSLLSLPLAAAESLPLAAPPALRGHARLVGAETAIWGAQLDGELRIGAIGRSEPEISFMETTGVGNLGQGFLKPLLVTIDHASARLSLRPNESAAGPPVRKAVKATGPRRYGIRFAGLGGDELTVMGVDADLAAQAGGLLAEDRILALNGEDVSALSQAERVAALRGSPLELRVRRGEELIELRLSLD